MINNISSNRDLINHTNPTSQKKHKNTTNFELKPKSKNLKIKNFCLNSKKKNVSYQRTCIKFVIETAHEH